MVTMASHLLSASAVTTLLIIVTIIMLCRLRSSHARSLLAGKKADQEQDNDSSLEPTKLSMNLASALPDSVIFPRETVAFKRSMNSYWAQQECEVVPACVVRPHNAQQLSTAVTILKHEFDEQRKQRGDGHAEGLFAIRGGGHSPVSGAASIKGGVVIDLGHFCEVNPSADGKSVDIGAGAKWMDVSKVLDAKGLAVVGGRNSAVGVGGLTLGGGLSFFSPRYGLVCSNIISYEVVLASGSIVTASESTNPDLWCALKGGSNNFGIVTRFTVRSFPSTKIWSGFIYMPSIQAPKVLAAFHESVNRTDSDAASTAYSNHAAGPIACFSYVHQLGAQIVSVNLVYTKLPEKGNKWPACWKSTPFASLWRLWSTCKVRSITSAMDEMNALNPPGRRQIFANTTIKNDPATLTAAHAAYIKAIVPLRRASVKELVWTLVLQPLLPEWARKGDANPMGLGDGPNEPLVIVSFTVNWAESRDDEVVKTTTRKVVEEIEAAAAANKTGHRYRYLNYCADWQKPFAGYGEENWRYLRGVSKSYDPDRLFQRGCVGGFKLDVADGEA